MSDPDQTFREVLAAHGGAIERLCRASERDPVRRHDLQQEVLLAVWRSLAAFRGESSLRTWVLRVAHNVAATHVGRRMRDAVLVDLDDVDPVAPEVDLDRHRAVARLYALLDRLRPLDRQVMLLWLEGGTQQEIAEITGLSATHVSTKVHRLKAALADQVRRNA
jgi:RNA polymerase sigma-70 factor (ECF subfamily)